MSRAVLEQPMDVEKSYTGGRPSQRNTNPYVFIYGAMDVVSLNTL